MARNELTGLRRSQIVGVYGPGAIVDFQGGKRSSTVSAVVAGLDTWDDLAAKSGLANDQVIYEPRLQKKLGVKGFRLPPVAPDIAPGVKDPNADCLAAVRFPKWQQCPRCHRVQPSWRWSRDPGEPPLYCSPCSDDLPGSQRAFVIPVRFVRICARGHLDEFPWDYWVEHHASCEKDGALKLQHDGRTSGLGGLILSCDQCHARRAMEGCFSPKNFQGLRCRGKRPWLADADEAGCEEEPRVVQRGASNLYYAMVDSSLDIPPWSDPLQKKLEVHWSKLEELPPEKLAAYLDVVELPQELGMSLEELTKRVERMLSGLSELSGDSIRWEEYQQFTKYSSSFGENTQFEIRPTDPPPEHADWIDKVVIATRLREVRAMVGFTRVEPPAGLSDPRKARLSLSYKNWLPAVENRGEGLFLRLDEDTLGDWESLPHVKARVAKIDKQHKQSWISRTGSQAGRPEVTPRLVLLHSLSHCLLERLSLDCGYASASLKERLYASTGDTPMAGLLIYTASPDVDGTLGGLAAQGEPDRLVRILDAGLQALRWCSSDPLCIEQKISASHGQNGAACHSCMLVAETSCEHFNYLLDRALLVGTPEDPSIGYFQGLLDALDTA